MVFTTDDAHTAGVHQADESTTDLLDTYVGDGAHENGDTLTTGVGTWTGWDDTDADHAWTTEPATTRCSSTAPATPTPSGPSCSRSPPRSSPRRHPLLSLSRTSDVTRIESSVGESRLVATEMVGTPD